MELRVTRALNKLTWSLTQNSYYCFVRLDYFPGSLTIQLGSNEYSFEWNLKISLTEFHER